LARPIAGSTYGRAKICKKCPKDTARYYERNPKLRLLNFYSPTQQKGGFLMKKMIISTLAAFASSACLGFAAQDETEMPEKYNAVIEQGETSDDDITSKPPVLEKCKKKKR
jgi:hypothetical protein